MNRNNLRESDPYTAPEADAVRLDATGADSLATSHIHPPESADPPQLPARSVPPSQADLRAATGLAALCEEFLRLTRDEHLPCATAAAILGKRNNFFSGEDSVLARYRRGGLAALVRPARSPVGGELSQRLEAMRWFLPGARFFYLLTNRTWCRGSVPEAVRRVISLPNLPSGWQTRTRHQFERLMHKHGCDVVPIFPPELREEILARERAGRPLVPGRIARQISVNPVLVQSSRNPSAADLSYCNSAGCSKFTRHSGAYTPLYAGQRMQPDDGSINFCVVVPWGFPTNACARKYGAMVGRFQLLLAVDALSLSIRARSFVVRPRSSYRQEDALHLYHIYMQQHGVPEEIWHEGGVWNAGRVKDCLDLLQVRRHQTYSPHNKTAVEGRFNKLWTVLSAKTGGQIGRYRGEMEKENALLTSCRAGHTDPWQVFPSLSVALPVIDEAIAEACLTPVQTDVGRWVPDELWEQHSTMRVRALAPETEWMFWPWMVERVVSNGVTTRVPLFEDFSVPFTFAAPWMPRYHGARVRCYFDPYTEARASAMVVLAQDWEGEREGAVLGPAVQTNDIAEYARQLLGYGTGPDDMGRRMKQAQAAALRSERRAIMPHGAAGARVSEERNGIDTVTRIDTDPARGKEPAFPRLTPQTYTVTRPDFD